MRIRLKEGTRASAKHVGLRLLEVLKNLAPLLQLLNL